MTEFKPLSAIAAPILARLANARTITNDVRSAELRRLTEANKQRAGQLNETIKRLQPNWKEIA